MKPSNQSTIQLQNQIIANNSDNKFIKPRNGLRDTQESIGRMKNGSVNYGSLTSLWKGVSSMAETAKGQQSTSLESRQVSKMNNAKVHLKMMEHNRIQLQARLIKLAKEEQKTNLKID